MTPRPAITAAVVAAVALLTACAPRQPVGDESRHPAPSSPLPRPVVNSDALAWAARRTPSAPAPRTWAAVTPTSSMLPHADARTVVLLIEYTGQPLRRGMFVRFDRGDLPNVFHRIEDITPTHFYASGTNVPRSDGWFPLSAISHICAGLLFADSP